MHFQLHSLLKAVCLFQNRRVRINDHLILMYQIRTLWIDIHVSGLLSGILLQRL
jgi:hypothetical protein